MPPPPPSEAQLEAALDALSAPGRLAEAERLVAAAAPQLQRILAAALHDGGWFDSAHDQAVRDTVTREDHDERLRAVQTLVAEETRLAMLVGVAIGYELAQELRTVEQATAEPPPDPQEDQ